jgi:hypothetical protein
MIFMFAAGAWAADPVPDKINIAKENNEWRVTGKVLEAVVAADGCLTRLRFPFPGEHWAHVPNYLKTGTGLPGEAGAGGSRGCYFYRGEILRLTDIKPDGENALIAQNNEAMVRYEFSPESLKWKLTNKSDKPMQFFMVLDPTVQAVANDKGGIKKTPAIELWPDITLYQGKRRLKVNGVSRIWGPGEVIGHDWRQSCFQVLEVTLNPKETRLLTLTPGIASDDEVNTVRAIAPDVPNRGSKQTQMIAPLPAVDGQLTVFSPRDYQVFQRRTKLKGTVFFSGHLLSPCDKVEYRLSGRPMEGKLNEEWRELPLNRQLNAFQSEVEVPAGGWYRAELRALLSGKQVASAVIERVGVGEVFIGCGQSNSTNCGAEPTKTATGMVSSFNGVEWQLANDPQPGTHDDSRFGSFWPSFGDAMFAKYKVPIGVAVTGQGGAPVSAWTPGSPAFIWLTTRMMALGKGGFRAVLWHQGESNVNGTSEDYYQKLSTTVKATHAVAGCYFPWFVAQVSYTNAKTPSFASTRDAQKRLWDEGIALEGPDTDTLVGDDRAGVHLSVKGLKRHGEMWTEKVGVYLDKVLAE